jgi:murein DD-endopeptidase MepM/ murein hydrolase activator NlpD
MRVAQGLALVACGLAWISAGCGAPRSRGPVRADAEMTGPAVHVVQRGETLYGIGRRYGVSAEELARVNGLSGTELSPGQRLRVPGREGRPAPQRFHVVRRGENLYRIALRYGTGVEALARANRLTDATRLEVGQRLVIPAASDSGRRAVRSARVWSSADPRGRSDKPGQFVWPSTGQLASGFGVRDGAHHDGVDILAPRGTRVRATAAGRVIFADDSLAGYGNLIIIKHAGKYSSVYAHNDRILVKLGQFVEQGDVIAEVGQTGRASAPHLHFEIRSDGKARDPLRHLP